MSKGNKMKRGWPYHQNQAIDIIDRTEDLRGNDKGGSAAKAPQKYPRATSDDRRNPKSRTEKGRLLKKAIFSSQSESFPGTISFV
jgi:hypothetical protein